MIKLDEARRRIGRQVTYTAGDGTYQEVGVITEVRKGWVFVRYGDEKHAMATHPDSLDWAKP